MSEPTSPAATEKELRDAFKLFDRDGSGTITSEEFTAIVTRPGGGKPLTIDQAARLFRRADLNGDGVVDYGEFCKSWGVIRKGGDDEKLADLQAPDAKHLMLGINLEGLREACKLWSASRSDTPARIPGAPTSTAPGPPRDAVARHGLQL